MLTCFNKRPAFFIKLAGSVAFAIALVAGAAIIAVPANASTIDWTLSGVTFDDTGTASGTFSTDSTTGNLIAYNITTTLGTTLSGYVYDSTTSGIYGNNVFDPTSFLITGNNSFVPYINLAFVNPLTSPGVYPLVPFDFNVFVGSYECDNCFQIRYVVSGEAVSSVPLPAALPLFATGLGALGLLGWRRKRKAAAAIAA